MAYDLYTSENKKEAAVQHGTFLVTYIASQKGLKKIIPSREPYKSALSHL